MSAEPTDPPPAGQTGAVPPADSSAALQEKLVEFLKSPAVLAGGALVAGVALSRLVGAAPLRALAAQLLSKGAKSPDSAPLDLEKILPELKDRAKKMLAEFLTKKE